MNNKSFIELSRILEKGPCVRFLLIFQSTSPISESFIEHFRAPGL